MKPTHIIILILGILLVLVGGDIAGHYANRYSLVDGGRYRIDHISGQVWEKKTKEVFDIEIARRTYGKLIKREPSFKNQSEAQVLNFIYQQYMALSSDDWVVENRPNKRDFECMRDVSYWEPIGASKEQALMESDEIPSMIATSVEVDEKEVGESLQVEVDPATGHYKALREE